MDQLFKIWKIEFNAKNIAHKQIAIVNNQKISWEFKELNQITSKPSLITHLEKGLSYQFSSLAKIDLEEKIDAIRTVVMAGDEAAMTYLSEIEDPEQARRIYRTFLQQNYVEIREFMNQHFLNAFFMGLIDEQIKDKNNTLNPILMLDFYTIRLKLILQKNLLSVIKALSKIFNNDQTLVLLIQQYEVDIQKKSEIVKSLFYSSIIKE